MWRPEFRCSCSGHSGHCGSCGGNSKLCLRCGVLDAPAGTNGKLQSGLNMIRKALAQLKIFNYTLSPLYPLYPYQDVNLQTLTGLSPMTQTSLEGEQQSASHRLLWRTMDSHGLHGGRPGKLEERRRHWFGYFCARVILAAIFEMLEACGVDSDMK